MVVKIPQKHWWSIQNWEKWESWNPNGRPKSGVALFNDELQKKWYEPVTKQDIEVNYMSMLWLPNEELIALSLDIEKPYLVQLIASNLLWNRWFDVLESMLDRSIGKPRQTVDSNVTGKLELVQFDHIDKLVEGL